MSVPLSPGASVVIAALCKSPELNGKTGLLGGYDADTQRWQVDVQGIGWRKIKENNSVRVASGRTGSKRLCWYGQACYKPDCWFQHGDNRTRCEHFLASWQQTGHPLVTDPGYNNRPRLEFFARLLLKFPVRLGSRAQLHRASDRARDRGSERPIDRVSERPTD